MPHRGRDLVQELFAAYLAHGKVDSRSDPKPVLNDLMIPYRGAKHGLVCFSVIMLCSHERRADVRAEARSAPQPSFVRWRQSGLNFARQGVGQLELCTEFCTELPQKQAKGAFHAIHALAHRFRKSRTSLSLRKQSFCTSVHQRKALMADLSDGFAALPGGYGTCDEWFEILTWAQLGLHNKPIGVLNLNGFFTALLGWLDHTVAEGFVRPAHRRLVLEADEPERLLDLLLQYRPPAPKAKWIEPKDR